MWRLVDGRRTVGEIIGLLEPHFGADKNYASRVAAYIVQLQRDGFIRLLARKEGENV